jgi:hypothetical protein
MPLIYLMGTGKKRKKDGFPVTAIKVGCGEVTSTDKFETHHFLVKAGIQDLSS